MYIAVKVIPKSPETLFVEQMADETYKIRLKAAPEKGKANEELIRYLSKACQIPKESIKIISGHTDTRKLLKVPDHTDLTLL